MGAKEQIKNVGVGRVWEIIFLLKIHQIDFFLYFCTQNHNNLCA